MAPKFRGDSDDWLDNEAPKTGKSGRLKKSKVDALPPEQANATVAEVFPNQCRVRMDAGHSFLCGYKRAAVIGEKEFRERSPVSVGDRVLARQTSPDAGVIDGVCARKNYLQRKAPGRDSGKVLHVLAANVDIVVILASVREPEFSPGLVDRFLIAAAAADIHPILCISKIDLVSNDRPWQVYRDIGVETYEESAKSGYGIEEIRARLINKTVVFCGHSGVGKTSLLRQLLGRQVGQVGDVSHATGKGRHTTTSAVLLEGPGSSRWIDTPGVREFGLHEIPPEKLWTFFPEFAVLECARERSCLHESEEHCSAHGLPRYPSYQRIMASLRNPTDGG